MNKNIGRNDPCPCGSGKKYKKCCMEEKEQIKDCFGDQGGSMLHGEPPEDCLKCDIFDRCHKVTIAASIQGINMDLSLFIQNGLEAGWLKCFKELSKEK
jgi:hypothetical protein